MRMPPEYCARPYSITAYRGGAHYMSAPTEYHRYPYRGHRNAIDYTANVRPERFDDFAEVVCDVAANYDDGDTFTLQILVFQGGTPQTLSTTAGHYDSITFEYTAGTPITPGNIEINIAAATTAEEVRTATLLALRTVLGGYATAELSATAATIAIKGKGPKTYLAISQSGLTPPAAVADRNCSGDDAAFQPRGKAGGMIGFQQGPGGPQNQVIYRGNASQFLPYNI